MITKVDDVNKDSDFYKCMYGICIDDAQADEVVKLLEGISSDAPMPYSREFCISYVIKLLEKYCSADECELALARYGFLDGFERKKYKRIGKRTEEYWKYARNYNQHEFISDDWTTTGTALTELKNQHMIIVGNLDEKTSQIKSENNNKLGLIEEVPKELEFPKPREVEESPDNSSEEPIKISAKKWKKIKLPLKWLKKFIDPKDTVKILIFLFMALMLWKIAHSLNDSQKPQQYTEIADGTPIAESEGLTITGITIDNAPITLTPDKPWERLSVSISPSEANIDDVQFFSYNPHLVVVNRDEDVVVQLASEWRKETERSTQVHAQFEEIDKAVPVTVQEKIITDGINTPDVSIGDIDNSANTQTIPGF